MASQANVDLSSEHSRYITHEPQRLNNVRSMTFKPNIVIEIPRDNMSKNQFSGKDEPIAAKNSLNKNLLFEKYKTVELIPNAESFMEEDSHMRSQNDLSSSRRVNPLNLDTLRMESDRQAEPENISDSSRLTTPREVTDRLNTSRNSGT